MTSPSSHQLPGNGFSVWTQQPAASHAVQLVSATSAPEEAADIPEKSTEDSGSGTFATYPEPSKSSGGGGGFLKWAALFLFLCALTAFLSSESKRKEVVQERNDLQVDKANLTKEKQAYHDSWVEEQGVTARLTDEIGGLEVSLATSKANVVQLTAEKNGLSKTIIGLRDSLAMAIEDHKNTEASLQKVIKGLETKNSELASTLQQERDKLAQLDSRLSEVMSELNDAKDANQQLADENSGLRDKVAQLQSSLEKTVKDAESRENELRRQIGDLQETNTALSASLESQKQELYKVREQLKASEEALASEKEAGDNSQSQVNDLASKLQDAVARRDALEQEKEALATSVADLTVRLEESEPTSEASLALQEKVASLEDASVKSVEQIRTLETTRDNLLERNAQLQSSVEELNGHLSKLAEKEEAEESSLTKRIEELTKTNAELKESLKAQRTEFNTLLRQANRDVTPLTEPSASVETDTEALQGAVRDLKNTLGQSIAREAGSKEEISSLLAAHTEEMLDLNTQMALTNGELAAAKGLLSELDGLRTEVSSLKSQGEELQAELAQRATHISTLSKDNASWQQETQKLRQLLETEQVAQVKLREFVNSLQTRIDHLEKPVPAVAEK